MRRVIHMYTKFLNIRTKPTFNDDSYMYNNMTQFHPPSSKIQFFAIFVSFALFMVLLICILSPLGIL